MPTTSLTKYCCNYHEGFVGFSDSSIDCAKTYTITNISAISGSNFGSWTNGVISARACAQVTDCVDGAAVQVLITLGCIPASLWPLQISYDVYENGVFFTSVQYTSNLQTNRTCPNNTCSEICT